MFEKIDLVNGCLDDVIADQRLALFTTAVAILIINPRSTCVCIERVSMELEIIFRGTDPSDAMEKYVIKYVEKFKKYMGHQDPHSTFVHVVLEGHHNHHLMMVEVRVKSQMYDLVVRRDGQDMYELIDETMKIMERNLQEHKQRAVDDMKQRKKCC